MSDCHLSGDGLLSAPLIRDLDHHPDSCSETLMPTIAFVSPKGGAGKTTSAFLLATALARFQDVTVIDADPNHPIQTWAIGGNAPSKLTVVADVDEDTIIERIEDAASKTPFVIVDLEGTASKIVV